MKTLKWISLVILVLGLCSSQVCAQCGNGIAITISAEYQGTETQVSTAHVGVAIDYDVTVTLNLIDCPITDGVVTLTLPNLTVITLDTTLALNPGESHEYLNVGAYTISAGDRGQYDSVLISTIVPADTVAGVAHVDATAHTDTGGTLGSTATNEWWVEVISNPDTEVGIEVSPDTGPIGFSATLTITEENTGEDPLTDVHVDIYEDTGGGEVLLTTLIAPPNGGGDDGDGILEPGTPGETWTWTVPVGPISVATTYVAYGFGTDPLGTIVSFANGFDLERATDEATPECPEPCLTIEKFVDCGVSKVGDQVIYTICIENCGQLPLTEVVVTDPHLSPDPLPGFPSTLNPEDGLICVDFPYTIQESDEPGPIENQATVQAIQVCGEEITPIIEVSNIVTVDLVHPCLDIDVKCIADGTVTAGGQAEFSVSLENCGDVPLEVNVFTSLGICESEGPLIILPGETPSCTSFYDIPIDFVDPEICLEAVASWSIFEGGECLTNTGEVSDSNCCTLGGQEGCTPGFWKNNGDKHGASAWCERFSPSDPISMHFVLNDPLVIRGKGKSTTTDPTLLQALDANGGGVNAMIRHGIAAMLNACSDCVQYEYSSPDDVISMIEGALNGDGPYTVDELHSMFAEANEAGCPVNQHGECTGVEDEIMLP